MTAAVLNVLPKRRGRRSSPETPAALRLFPSHTTGLYYVYAVGFAGGVVKVGMSRNPRSRIRQHWKTAKGEVLWAHLFEGGTQLYARMVENRAPAALAGIAQRINLSEWYFGDDRSAVIKAIRDLIRPAKIDAEETAGWRADFDRCMAIARDLMSQDEEAEPGEQEIA